MKHPFIKSALAANGLVAIIAFVAISAIATPSHAQATVAIGRILPVAKTNPLTIVDPGAIKVGGREVVVTTDNHTYRVTHNYTLIRYTTTQNTDGTTTTTNGTPLTFGNEPGYDILAAPNTTGPFDRQWDVNVNMGTYKGYFIVNAYPTVTIPGYTSTMDSKDTDFDVNLTAGGGDVTQETTFKPRR